MEYVDIFSKIAQIAQLAIPFIAIWAICISKKHLKEVNKHTKLSTTEIEINIFSELEKRKNNLFKSVNEYTKTEQQNNTNQNTLEFLKSEANHSKENYLNFLDTICLYVLEGYITETNFKKQYKDSIAKIIKLYKNDFGEDSAYDNIQKINTKFQHS